MQKRTAFPICPHPLAKRCNVHKCTQINVSQNISIHCMYTFHVSVANSDWFTQGASRVAFPVHVARDDAASNDVTKTPRTTHPV